VFHVAWCSGRAPKDWQSGLITQYTKKEAGVNAPITGAFLSLAFQEGPD